MNGAKALAEVGQSFTRKLQRFGIAVNANDSSLGRRFKNRLAVSAEAGRAIDKETPSLRSEVLHRFS
jgi:hypothetical protein